MSNTIKLDFEGSTPPITDNKYFFVGKLWRTSKVDMAHGAWAKSSTIL
jgi:hypothetical protein